MPEVLPIYAAVIAGKLRRLGAPDALHTIKHLYANEKGMLIRILSDTVEYLGSLAPNVNDRENRDEARHLFKFVAMAIAHMAEHGEVDGFETLTGVRVFLGQGPDGEISLYTEKNSPTDETLPDDDE